MEEICIKTEPNDDGENYGGTMATDIKVEEDPFLLESNSQIELNDRFINDVKVEELPLPYENTSLEGLYCNSKINDIKDENSTRTEGKRKENSDTNGQQKFKRAKTNNDFESNEKNSVIRDQENSENEPSDIESNDEVAEESNDDEYLPSDVKRTAKKKKKEKELKSSLTAPKRRRKTQQEKLMVSVLEKSPPEVPMSLAFDAEEYSKEIGAKPACKKKVLKEATRWAIYSASRTANAMAHLMHNQLYIPCPELQKKQLKPTIPYHGWCRYPSLHGSVAKEVKRLKISKKSTLLSCAYDTACKSNCRTDYFELIRNCSMNDDAARVVLEKHGILPSPGDVICPNGECKGNLMKLTKLGDRLVWRCRKRFKISIKKKKAKQMQCNKVIPHKTAIFQDINLPTSKILMFMQEFIDKDFKIEKTARRCGICISSARKMQAVLKDVCADTCKSQKPIGGPGSTIEIDVTCSQRKKVSEISRGCPEVKEVMLIFGKERYGTGYFLLPLIFERTDENELINVVPDLSKELSLITNLEKYIRPGSIIMSNGWSLQEKLSDYPKDKRAVWRYKHYIVKSKYKSIRNDPWIHTNFAKTNLNDVKKYCKQPGINIERMRSYIGHYLLLNGPYLRRCTTWAKYQQHKKYIAETALHRFLIAFANYNNKKKDQA